MNYRLIVEYHDTGIITEQYFPDTDTPDTIINYLFIFFFFCSRLEYLLQQKTKTNIKTIDGNSDNYSSWFSLSEWHD